MLFYRIREISYSPEVPAIKDTTKKQKSCNDYAGGISSGISPPPSSAGGASCFLHSSQRPPGVGESFFLHLVHNFGCLVSLRFLRISYHNCVVKLKTKIKQWVCPACIQNFLLRRRTTNGSCKARRVGQSDLPQCGCRNPKSRRSPRA